jgi:hypothetical protein
MSEIATILDRVSAYSFASSLILSKLKHLPIGIWGSITYAASLALQLIANSAWYAASIFYPDLKPAPQEWYSFATYKQQNSLAAGFGVIATACAIASIWFPPLLLVSAWVFTASNIAWYTGEYHKLKSPHKSERYSHEYQKNFTEYTKYITAIGVVAALAPTLILFFPLATLPITIGAGVVAGISAINAAKHWFLCNFVHTNTPPSGVQIQKKQPATTHTTITDKQLRVEKEPYHTKSLFFTGAHGNVGRKSYLEALTSNLNTPSIRIR